MASQPRRFITLSGGDHMEREPDWRNTRRLLGGAMAAALVLSAAACTAAQLPSAASSTAWATESQTPSWTTQPVGPTFEASPAVTPGADATSSYVTAPTDTPTAVPVALARVAPLPGGKWTSAHWTHGGTPRALPKSGAASGGHFRVFGCAGATSPLTRPAQLMQARTHRR